MNSVRLTVALCLVFIGVVVGLFVYSVTRAPVLTDEQLLEQGIFILPRPREIAPFELTDHTGAPFTLDDLQGRWSFLFFGFTNCPDVCPTAMSVLAQAEQRLREIDPQAAERFHGVLVSVDPERDDEAALAAYVGAFSPRFTGVRGSREQVAELGLQLNVAFAKVPDGDSYQVDHTANMVIVNPRGHYHGFIKMPHQADKIVAAFQTLSTQL